MASVEYMEAAVRRLVAERQALHARAAGGGEVNRLELVHCQQELARALVARCLRRPATDAS